MMTKVEDKRHFLYILSGKAGNGKALSYRREISEFMQQAGLSERTVFLETRYENHCYDEAFKFARQYEADGLVYVSGGDGTVNEITNALLGTECAFGVIPTGTANDFAKTIYGKKRIAPQRLFAGAVVPILQKCDVVRLHFPPEVVIYTQQTAENAVAPRELERNAVGGVTVSAVNVVSFGYDTLILYDAYRFLKRCPWLGGVAYFLSVLRNVFNKKSTPVELVLSGTEGQSISFTGEALLVALCNGGFYGNGFNPAPQADPGDRVLQMSIVEPVNIWQFIPLVFKYHRGTQLGHKKIQLHDVVCGKIRHSEGKSLRGNYDGIIFETPELEFEILPQALNIALPKLL